MKLQSVVGVACGLALLSGLAGALSGFRMTNAYESSGERTATIVSSLRQHMTADMMHDNLRGVVFRSLYAASIQDKEMAKDAQEDLKKAAQTFRDAIKAQQALDLPLSVRTPLAELAAPLNNYVNSAEAIVGLGIAGKSDEGKAALPAFLASFAVLEKEMSDVSDAIEKAGSTETASAAALGKASMVANWIILALAGILFTAYFVLCRRLVIRPLVGVAQAMLAVAAGKQEEPAAITSGIAEIQDLSSALTTFRAHVLDRN